MPIVKMLVDLSETELYEEYLDFAWRGMQLGPVPNPEDLLGSAGAEAPLGGAGAVALMRLVIQCQDDQKQELLRAAYEMMPPGARDFLSFELALTGVARETFRLAPDCRAGPALLIYYLPAYVRFACAHQKVEEASGALSVVAEVARIARTFWPREEGEAARGQSITIMIDELKSRTLADIRSEYGRGNVWALTRNDELHASVRLKKQSDLIKHAFADGGCELLELWRVTAHEGETMLVC